MAATHKVTGGAVVLRNAAGSSQYLYRGAVFESETFTDDSVKHAVANGLIEKIDDGKSSGKSAAAKS